ncbi:hypothetical protein O3M35_011756 [Rhynocoris fuscipes]|uniref:DNA-directed RNA polymerase III subunit RPC4 n=1 Tax=Rhynocoris fuscipes TaxID=488301 RepID=A0AAW1CXT3_9HEMI
MPGDSDQQVTIKTELGAAFKRLPSFRTPRDLKLSEFRDIRSNPLNENRSKRVFIPNLNVQRKKQNESVDKDVSAPNNDTAKANPKERGRREDRGRGRGRGRKPANFIQGAGVFSEGLAPALKLRNNIRNNESSSSIPKPRINLKLNEKVNKEEEEEVMKELLRDDFIEDPDIQPDLLHCPVRLPLQDCKDFIPKEETEEIYAKQETFENNINGIKVKKEPGSLEDKSEVPVLEEPDSKPFNLKHMMPLTIPQMLSKSSEKSFLFFQIPSCLPGMKVNLQSAAQNSKKDNQKTEEDDTERCVLRTLPPGLIGKLQILKSGRARLILGDAKLWLEPGTQTAFKQDLISVNLDTNNKTGSMINMGELTTRMLITPDWESLLLKDRFG